MTRRCWFLVPARGGSRRLPRKNVLSLAGEPLVAHVLKTLTDIGCRAETLVITDDDEIDAIAASYNVRVIREARTTGERTLDDVGLDICRRLTEEGASRDDILVTIQPTCPFISAQTIAKCIALFEGETRTVLTVCDDRHLRWSYDGLGRPVPMYQERVNRQVQKPVFRETGGVIAGFFGDILDTGSRVQQGRVAILEVDQREAIDIDDYTDLLVAQHFARQRKVLIRADGSPDLGLGHVYRALALATQLAGYGVDIITRCDGEYALGHRLLSTHAFTVHPIDGAEAFVSFVADTRPDIVFLDILDTDRATIQALRPHADKIVTFEDFGEGASLADLVVNDLYVSGTAAANILTGVEYTLLSNAFDHMRPKRGASETVERILILFGGTDPSCLTEKALATLGAIGFGGEVTLVLGPGKTNGPASLEGYGLKGKILCGASNMAQVISGADLALSSAGRTVTELMTMGVPTLVLCQNRRELLHSHASMPYGVMNLGLGRLVDDTTLRNTIEFLIGDRKLRSRMSELMLRATANRNNRSIVRCIEQKLGLV